jgi:hypothetical protein
MAPNLETELQNQKVAIAGLIAISGVEGRHMAL